MRIFRSIRSLGVLLVGAVLLPVSLSADLGFCIGTLVESKTELTRVWADAQGGPVEQTASIPLDFFQRDELSTDSPQHIYFQILPSLVKGLRDHLPADEVNQLLMAGKQRLYFALHDAGLDGYVHLIDFKSLRLQTSGDLTAEQWKALEDAFERARGEFRKDFDLSGLSQDQQQAVLQLLSNPLLSVGFGNSENVAVGVARLQNDRERGLTKGGESRADSQNLSRQQQHEADLAELAQRLKSVHQLGKELITLWAGQASRRDFLNSRQDSLSLSFVEYLKDADTRAISQRLEREGELEGVDVADEVNLIVSLANAISPFVPAPQYDRVALRPERKFAEGQPARSSLTIDLRGVGSKLHLEIFDQILEMESLQELNPSENTDHQSDVLELIDSLGIPRTLDHLENTLSKLAVVYENLLADQGIDVSGFWYTGDEFVIYLPGILPSPDRVRLPEEFAQTARLVQVQVAEDVGASEQLGKAEALRMRAERFSKELEKSIKMEGGDLHSGSFHLRLIQGSESLGVEVVGSQALMEFFEARREALEEKLTRLLDSDFEFRTISLGAVDEGGS